MQQPQLIARDIYKSFRMGARRIEVLRGISMDIAHNETVFLSGASGAGKTTLLYTLAGLEHPESGTVKFEGRKLYSGSSYAEARLRNEKMGFVFQGYFLLPELTALENVLLPAMIGCRTTKGEAEESLAAVGLGDRMHHLPAELSGGEQQRVAIARALTNNPDIIFVLQHAGMLEDLSPQGRAAWRDGMKRLAGEHNIVSKLSGLGTFIHRNDAAHISDVVLQTAELFGAQRCLFGSNFPIEKLWTSYAEVVRVTVESLSGLSAGDQRAVLHDTAARVYRLPPS